MQQLTIGQCSFLSFKTPFLKPFTFAGHEITERNGFYLTLQTSGGLNAQGEAAPLEGFSPETIRRAKHDLAETCSYLKEFNVPRQKDELLEVLRHDGHILNLCASVRFSVESAILLLAAQAAGKSLAEFLGAQLKDVRTAVLLQGTYQDVMADVKRFSQQVPQVFKLKVGDRNIALDVKKVQDIRALLDNESYLRLDANRVWSLKEACVFAELAGNQKIDFIEEPVNDPAQLGAFYEKTHMRMALDETLVPGCCSLPLAQHEGIVAYVLKPMLLGVVPVLDWIKEAGLSRRKAIVSSAFESPVGFRVLAHLACLAGQVAGLGTERWFKNPIMGEIGVIKKEFLIL
ncbi:MAG: o-succinylbenzoate synthase [Candidatus Omnitrophica bacterium]|nr:o-succinylbenzoate synthase [Candidatus Omnitrophota bacterium]MDE2008782.1 o-succinylbenzoate synthase [Candidatus Omnitrophota bacterium]MDE2213655.1 o-succinylbenzoate synthase [Candidatus Omnitrophota bacterium]MDE2230444.1 o-succinylbenzoate synthase [Candidatus Omnitrophota bacterium]